MTGIYQVSNYTPCQIGLVKGERGENGANGANGLNGKDGKDGKDGLRGLSGSDGKSLYQIALDNGFVGTFDDYQETLRGEKGLKGDAGVDAAIDSLTVSTGAAGTSASVVTGGTPISRTFALTIPRGDKGDKGDKGDDVDPSIVDAAIAALPFEGGVLADTFVTVEEQITGEGALSLRDFNSRTVLTVNSMAELLQVKATAGRTVFVKGSQGGTFVYDSSKTAINDGGLVFDGWVRDIRDKRITPEMFGAKPNDATFDNTMALNTAFTTGFDLYGLPTDTYYITGDVYTKGQQLIGGWKLSTNVFDLGEVTTDIENIDTSTIKMIYVGDSHDLAQFLFIKNLGFNTLCYYGGQGNIQRALDTAKSAKLQVILNTEHGEAQGDYVAFVKKYDNHPATYAYTVFDEPSIRDFTVAQQDAKISALRAVTKRPLTMVDFVLNQSPFIQVFSTNYDIVFVDIYAERLPAITDLDARIEHDLSRMRLQYAMTGSMTKAQKVIPVVGLTKFKTLQYSEDINQILPTAEIFASVDKGNWGAFVWDDMYENGGIRETKQFQDLARKLNTQQNVKKLATDILLFGGRDAATETDWGVSSLFKYIEPKDSRTDVDEPINGGGYPIVLKKAEAESSRGTTTMFNDVNSISGIGFLGNWAAIVLNIKLRKNMRICLVLENTAPVGNTLVTMYETVDNGYTNELLWFDHNNSSETVKVYEENIKPSNPDAGLVLLVKEDAQTELVNYRKVLHGYIINTDW